MRHRQFGKHFSRDEEHRVAMFRNMASSLFEHGQIETTLPKAKAVQPYVEKLITRAKKGGFRDRRLLEQKLNDRRIHAWVADPNVPDSKKENEFFELPKEDEIEFNRYGEVRKAPRLIQHLLTKIAPRYEDRDGGYTRIIKLGKHRLGDGADLCLLQLVGEEDGPEIGGGVSGRRRQANRRAEFAASLRKKSSAKQQEKAEEPAAAVASAESAEGEKQQNA